MVSSAYFGQGTGPIHLGNVQCSGSEANLLQCSHSSGYFYCWHSKDPGIKCPGIDSKMTISSVCMLVCVHTCNIMFTVAFLP